MSFMRFSFDIQVFRNLLSILFGFNINVISIWAEIKTYL